MPSSSPDINDVAGGIYAMQVLPHGMHFELTKEAEMRKEMKDEAARAPSCASSYSSTSSYSSISCARRESNLFGQGASCTTQPTWLSGPCSACDSRSAAMNAGFACSSAMTSTCTAAHDNRVDSMDGIFYQPCEPNHMQMAVRPLLQQHCQLNRVHC